MIRDGVNINTRSSIIDGKNIEIKNKEEIMHWNYFIINVNTDYENIVCILNKIEKLEYYVPNSQLYKFKNYIVEVKKNEDYDQFLIKSEEDSFLYYKYEIYFSNRTEVTLENQIIFSKLVRDTFIRNNVYEVTILSEFEHLL